MSSSGPEPVKISSSLYEKLRNAQSYTALFHIQHHRGGGGGGGESKSTRNEWYWSHSSYVKLPLSSSYCKNEIGEGGVLVSTPRWDVIRKELTKLKSFCVNGQNQQYTAATEIKEKIQEAMKEYNARNAHPRTCNFEILDDRELSECLVNGLPAIVDHALKLEHRLKNAIPILKRGRCHTLYLTRNLACSLLANAFLCTFPDQPPKANLPDFNFIKLFHDHHDLPDRARLKREKLKCVLQYFSEMDGSRGQVENNIISYERRHIPNPQVNWVDSKAKLCKVELIPGACGGIEQAEGHLQVDFANKLVGGGVLDEGGVMEEIRFSISPELIVARLFTEALGEDEVLVVTGTRQFSSYSGYSSSFRFQPLGEPRPPVRTDDLGREFTQVVAMDALHFRPNEKWKQYTRASINRELHKCVVGFFHGRHRVTPIATGNWGCGAFNGDPQLKFLIQWMAASHVGRKEMFFHTSSDSQAREIQEVKQVMVNKDLTVGKVAKIFHKYEKDLTSLSPGNLSIFERVKEYCNKFRFF